MHTAEQQLVCLFFFYFVIYVDSQTRLGSLIRSWPCLEMVMFQGNFGVPRKFWYPKGKCSCSKVVSKKFEGNYAGVSRKWWYTKEMLVSQRKFVYQGDIYIPRKCWYTKGMMVSPKIFVFQGNVGKLRRCWYVFWSAISDVVIAVYRFTKACSIVRLRKTI